MRKPAIVRDVWGVLKAPFCFFLTSAFADNRTHDSANDFLAEAAAYSAHGAFDEGFANGFAGAATAAAGAAAK